MIPQTDGRARRVATEAMLRAEFERAHWLLSGATPVYLYWIPGMALDEVDRELLQRRAWDERNTRYLLFDLDALLPCDDITFTVGDSMRSYRRKLVAQGFWRRPDAHDADLPDHGHVFPAEQLPEVYRRNRHVPDLRFEVQVWDRDVLIKDLKEREPALWRALLGNA